MPAASDTLPAWFLSDDPRVVLAAAATVASQSSGRVRRPETIHRSTGKPEREGLHCARIFGPVDDHRCLCGKLATAEAAGQVCDKCGVLCGERRLRDERWGHIESPAPLVHPALAPRIAAALGCDVRGLMRVVRFEANLSADGRVVPIDEEVRARGPYHVAERLGALAAELMPTLVPVTPPTWRATRRDPQDAGYMTFVNRCNRLERLIELDAPLIILDNEARMTQEALEKLHAAVRAELRARGPVVREPATALADELLQAVYDDPGDDAPRRAYAEYLTAHGDLRGEFITRQLAGAGRSQMSRRERDMLRRNFDAWIAPLGEAVEPGVVFRRGFPAACKTIAAGAQARLGDPAWATIEHLETDLVALITDPVMCGLESLAVPLRTLRAVCEGPAVLPRVRALRVRMQRVSPEQVEAVTRCEALPGLRELTLVDESARGACDFRWLDGTALAGRLERLSLALAFEALESLSLRRWLEFLERHPALEGVTFTFGKRLVTCALRRERGVPALRLVTSRAIVERISFGLGEIAETLGRILTDVEPYELPLLQVDSPAAWFVDELAALAHRLRGHFGPAVRLPRLWT